MRHHHKIHWHRDGEHSHSHDGHYHIHHRHHRSHVLHHHEHGHIGHYRSEDGAKKAARHHRHLWIKEALGYGPHRLGLGPHHHKAVRKTPLHRGALHHELHVPMGHKIPLHMLEHAAHEPGITGKRARLALTLRGLKHHHGRRK